MLVQALVGLAMAMLSHARPWFNSTSVAAHGTGYGGYGSGLIATAPYTNHSSTKAAEAHAAGCSVAYVTVTTTSVSVSATASALPSTTSAQKPYSYVLESGTTSWIDGVAPPATGFASTVSESSTVFVGTITTTTTSTTTLTAPFSSELAITETTISTNTHILTRTRTKTKDSGGLETETANSTSWQWASPMVDTSGFPTFTPTGSEGLSFTGVHSAQTSATIGLPTLSSTGMLSALTSATIGLPSLSSTGTLSLQTNVTSGLPAPSSTKVSPVLNTPPAAPSPTTCGEIGNFTITWDDEPLFVPPKNSSQTLFPPVLSPYHHLFYANGFAYIAPEVAGAPFPPTSNPYIAIFMPDLVIDATAKNHSVFDRLLTGEITAGPRASDKIWQFDAYGADLGCDNGGSASCTMTITGYAYDTNTTTEYPVVQQKVDLSACNTTTLRDCSLKHVDFHAFRGLSGIQFEALVGERQKIFVMDNLNLGWCDNSCAAGLKRFRFGKN